LPTNNNGEKKVRVNGKEVPPAKKVKLPLSVDWQAKIREIEETTIEIDLDDLEEV
jgi:hypothetical protein